jgi:putative ABC transport system ATP-binding protein
MDKSFPRYVWTHTSAQQIWIMAVVLLSMVPYFLSFDLPKLIINGPIQGAGFETPDAVQTYLNVAFSLPVLGEVKIFDGVALDREGSLLFLCITFLLLVLINGAFKFYINTYKGRLGERMLRRMRYELVDRVLRFPPSQFKRVKPAEIATMVKDEVEPLGGFIGDAFVQPVLLGGQAATAMAFILVQNLWLGLISAGIVALQVAIIPQMRKRLLRLGRERQLTARELAGRVAEIAEGIGAVHTHDTSNYERADISARLGRIFRIRYDLYQWKFLVKFLNNFLSQVTPFLFYIVGGYQVFRGNLDVGQLVAVIAAYKDLPGPLKELIDWDQMRQDVDVKYGQIQEQFNIDAMIDPAVQSLQPQAPPPITQPISAIGVSVTDDSGARLLEPTSVTIRPSERIAIVGTAGSGGEALTESIARLVWPDGGRIAIGDSNLSELPESITGRRISYAAGDAYLFQGSLRDNLLYSLKHALQEPAATATSQSQRDWEREEARRSGNSQLDVNGNWIDYHGVGATGPADLLDAIKPVLDAVQLTDELLNLGLRSNPRIHRDSAIAARLVEARAAFRNELDAKGLTGLVVPFQARSYNPEATISENLLFGAATDSTFSDDRLATQDYFRSVLRKTGMDGLLYEAGLAIASQAVELFRDLPPDHPFFQRLSFMAAEEIPEYQSLLARLWGKPMESANEEERSRIISLSFAYVEPRHRFGILDEQLMARIVETRQEIHASLPAELAGQIERYDPDRYNTAASLLDNILLGRIGHRHVDGAERVRSIVRDILQEKDLVRDVVAFGLEFNAGVGGKRLTEAQRQKINLARAVIKRADYLILNRPLSALDHHVQRSIIASILDVADAGGHKPAVVWVLSSPAHASMFQRVIVFDKGAIVGDATYDEIKSGNEIFRGMQS